MDSNRLKNWDYSGAAIYFITIVTKKRQNLFGSIEEDKMILNENGQIIEKELLKSIKIRKNWFFHNWIVMPNHVHLLIEIQNNEVSLEINKKQTKIEQSQIERSQIVATHSSASTPSISTTNIDTKNPHTQIVETHSSASTPSISTKNIETNIEMNLRKHAETYVAETHCCAPLQCASGQRNQLDFESTLSRKSNSISSFVATFKSVTTKQINGSISIWQTNYHDHIVRNYKRFETIYNYIKTNPSSWETDSMNSNFQ